MPVTDEISHLVIWGCRKLTVNSNNLNPLKLFKAEQEGYHSERKIRIITTLAVLFLDITIAVTGFHFASSLSARIHVCTVLFVNTAFSSAYLNNSAFFLLSSRGGQNSSIVILICLLGFLVK